MNRPPLSLWLLLCATAVSILAPKPAAGQQEAATSPANGVPNPQQTRESNILASVNGEPLYVEDVSSVLGQMHEGVAADQRDDFDLDRMIFRLVNDTLLAQEARASGMGEDASIQRRLRNLRENLATSRLEKEEIIDRIELDPVEMERVYRKLFQIANLRIVSRKDEGEAREIRQELEAGADIEALARERSQDPYSMRGGLINDIPRMDLPGPIQEVVFSAQPGDLVGPIRTGTGWSVIRVDSLEPADLGQFEHRQGTVRNVIVFDQKEALREDLLARLRETHPVRLHEEAYDAIGVTRMSDGRLLPKIEDPDAVVIDAGGRQVLAAQFGQALAERWGTITDPEIALAIKPILLDNLTVDELITAEALRRGYGDTPEVVRELHARDTNLLVNLYLNTVVAPQVEVSRDEMEAYYEENRDQFRKPPRMRISQLTVESKEEADRILALARSGAEFAWLARKYSTDRFRDSGGVIGWVLANQGPTAFIKDLGSARAGDLLGPTGSQIDWKLLRVDAVEDQGHYEFQEVSGNARQRLEEQEFLRLVDEYIRTLRERSEIWINEEAMASLMIQATPEDPEATNTSPGHSGR